MRFKTPMQRREVIRLGSAALFSGLVFRLVGCGQASESPAPGYHLKDENGVRYRRIKDIAARPTGLRPGILKARDIVKGEPVTLYYDEGSHRHAYTLTKEHLNQLLKGQVVRLTTERVQGHTHSMVLDPNVNPVGADSVEVPEEPEEPRDSQEPQEPEEPQEPGSPPMYAALSEKDEIYVQAADGLDLESVEYCLGTVDACEADESLWKRMKLSERFQRQVFQSSEPLELADGDSLNLRGKKRGASGLAKLLLLITGQ